MIGIIVKRRLAVCGVAALLAGAGWPHLQTSEIEGRVRGTQGPIEGAVVYLEEVEAPNSPAATDTLVMDQLGLRFEPDILAVPIGSTVSFLNSDPVMHNVFSPLGPEPFDVGTYPAGTTELRTFTLPGVYTVLCHVHPEMLSYIVVVPTRHRAITDRRGRFRMTEIPPGEYALSVWHPDASPFTTSLSLGPGEVLSVNLQP